MSQNNQKRILVNGRNKQLLDTLLAERKTIPVFITKDNKISFFKRNEPSTAYKDTESTPMSSQYQEDIIYESKEGDFLEGNSQTKVIITNRLDCKKNFSRTTAQYIRQSDNKVQYVKTSDAVTKLIGQKSYDTVLSALLSVINQETKVKGIMGLLVSENDQSESVDKKFVERNMQTDENCMDIIYKMKQKKRVKRTHLVPYVVKDVKERKKEQEKVVVDPNLCKKNNDSTTIVDSNLCEKNNDCTKIINPNLCEENSDSKAEKCSSLPELVFNEDSNNSLGSVGNLSVISGLTAKLLDNPEGFFENIDQCTETLVGTTEKETQLNEVTNVKSEKQLTELQPLTINQSVQQRFNPTQIRLMDGTQIMVPVKPEDQFHIATPEILKNVTAEERKKLVWYQAYIDWKLALQRDEDDNLPIHIAVMNNDADVLLRQCLVLKNRKESVDITAGNLTALQMSICQDTSQCTAILLQHGADPLSRDDDHRTVLHLAAESVADHLKVVLTYAAKDAREILEDHEELWHEDMKTKSDKELAEHLINHMCGLVDDQGYTPLMLASKIGNYSNVQLLCSAAPNSVNAQMPNSGNTALYLAIGAAALEAANVGNKSKVPEHFARTISILVNHGADATLKNHSNTDVTELLQEVNIADLNSLVANKIHSLKFGDLPKKFDSYMIVKGKDGKKNIVDIQTRTSLDKSKDCEVPVSDDNSSNTKKRQKRKSPKAKVYVPVTSESEGEAIQNCSTLEKTLVKIENPLKKPLIIRKKIVQIVKNVENEEKNASSLPRHDIAKLPGTDSTILPKNDTIITTETSILNLDNPMNKRLVNSDTAVIKSQIVTVKRSGPPVTRGTFSKKKR